jgi:phage tail-like protein
MAESQLSPALVTFSHVADHTHCYPGETVTFHTRILARQALAGLVVKVAFAEGLTPGNYHPLPDGRVPDLILVNGTRYLIWTIERDLEAGERYEWQVEAHIAPTEHDLELESRASATANPAGLTPVTATESAIVSVSAKGRYLRYLPSLYQKDDLMGRLVMLFESFWAPVEQQIEHVPFYFDPRFTPSDFLPWLASWVDLVLDERWPEEKRRRLLRSAALLYRKRGTRRGLQDYLEIYTDVRPEIIEHRAGNFRLGPTAQLGSTVALGSNNAPHTFTVILRLPPIVFAGGDDEQARLERERRRMIETIIEKEKPAHTAYTLRLESTVG